MAYKLLNDANMLTSDLNAARPIVLMPSTARILAEVFELPSFQTLVGKAWCMRIEFECDCGCDAQTLSVPMMLRIPTASNTTPDISACHLVIVPRCLPVLVEALEELGHWALGERIALAADQTPYFRDIKHAA